MSQKSKTAWVTMHKLSREKITPLTPPDITPNQVGSQLVANGKQIRREQLPPRLSRQSKPTTSSTYSMRIVLPINNFLDTTDVLESSPVNTRANEWLKHWNSLGSQDSPVDGERD
ncbi:hypothetical protein SRHO_G00216210 [Serrasalmus rhombeus]